MNDQILTFFIVSFFLVASPGPNMALIIDNASRLGKKNSMFNILGLCSATYIHGAFSILGISVLILNNHSVYLTIKFLGAAYLLYMGVRSIKSGIQSIKVGDEIKILNKIESSTSILRSYMDGFITQILNPKVSIFYMAAFPSFMITADISKGFELVSVHSFNIFIWFTMMTIFISFAKNQLKKDKVRGWINIMTGTALSIFSLIIVLQ